MKPIIAIIQLCKGILTTFIKDIKTIVYRYVILDHTRYVNDLTLLTFTLTILKAESQKVQPFADFTESC